MSQKVESSSSFWNNFFATCNKLICRKAGLIRGRKTRNIAFLVLQQCLNLCSSTDVERFNLKR